jgi:hypothetical protein
MAVSRRRPLSRRLCAIALLWLAAAGGILARKAKPKAKPKAKGWKNDLGVGDVGGDGCGPESAAWEAPADAAGGWRLGARCDLDELSVEEATPERFLAQYSLRRPFVIRNSSANTGARAFLRDRCPFLVSHAP